VPLISNNKLEVKKTIACCLYKLTKRKQASLDEVYSAWQDMTKHGRRYEENRKLHPSLLAKYASKACISKPNDPIYLDTQRIFKIIKTDNKLQYFVGITIKPRLRIWCPLKTKQSFEFDRIHDSQLFKRDGHYELHLTISKDVSFDNAHPSSILAVDMGEKVIATAVLLGADSSFTTSQSNGVLSCRSHLSLRALQKRPDLFSDLLKELLHPIL